VIPYPGFLSRIRAFSPPGRCSLSKPFVHLFAF
jgi:hypothetical protein